MVAEETVAGFDQLAVPESESPLFRSPVHGKMSEDNSNIPAPVGYFWGEWGPLPLYTSDWRTTWGPAGAAAEVWAPPTAEPPSYQEAVGEQTVQQAEEWRPSDNDEPANLEIPVRSDYVPYHSDTALTAFDTEIWGVPQWLGQIRPQQHQVVRSRTPTLSEEGEEEGVTFDRVVLEEEPEQLRLPVRVDGTVWLTERYAMRRNWFKEVINRMGGQEMDVELFADSELHLLPTPQWVGPGARHDDAFNLHWHPDNIGYFWANPPFSRLGEVADKVVRDGARGVVICPRWANHQWHKILYRHAEKK